VFAWSYQELKTYDSHYPTHDPIKIWNKTFPSKDQKVPPISATFDVSRDEEIVRCQDYLSGQILCLGSQSGAYQKEF
jgi:hypothetical protein